MGIYRIYNGPMQTTAAAVGVTTGTAIKTLLQIKAGATKILRIKEWGISLSGFAAAAPGRVELVETDVAATVTAHVAAGITKSDAAALMQGDPTTALIEVGTSATGYTGSSEGTPTAIRNLDAPQFVAPSTQFVKQFPLGDEPIIQAGKFCRVRVHFAAAVDALCYVVVEG